MRHIGTPLIAALSLLVLFHPVALAKFKFAQNAWKNEYRKQILKAAGVIRENSDKSITYMRKVDLVEKPVSCVFTLDPKGQITFLKIVKSSGNNATDQTALAVIRRTAPFKIDPKSLNTQTVEFTTNDVIVTDGIGDR